MTPAARQKWVRQALQIVLEGSAELSDGVEALGRAIGALPSATDRKAITVLVRRGLRNRLRDRTATIRIGASLPEKINQDLEKFARAKGARIVERVENDELLAGFQIQIGDDRSDRTLLKNLTKF
jgi:hypothetical protein